MNDRFLIVYDDYRLQVRPKLEHNYQNLPLIYAYKITFGPTSIFLGPDHWEKTLTNTVL